MVYMHPEAFRRVVTDEHLQQFLQSSTILVDWTVELVIASIEQFRSNGKLPDQSVLDNLSVNTLLQLYIDDTLPERVKLALAFLLGQVYTYTLAGNIVQTNCSPSNLQDGALQN